MTRASLHYLSSVLLAAGVAALARPAQATPNFPGVIQSALGLSSPPPCTICHLTSVGGPGTAVQPFALYLKSRGLVPYDEASLRAALQAAAAERHDSNGNGIDDIDELTRGTDPNAGATAGPAYGCGARIAQGPPARSSVWAFALALVASACARKRSSYRKA